MLLWIAIYVCPHSTDEEKKFTFKTQPFSRYSVNMTFPEHAKPEWLNHFKEKCNKVIIFIKWHHSEKTIWIAEIIQNENEWWIPLNANLFIQIYTKQLSEFPFAIFRSKYWPIFKSSQIHSWNETNHYIDSKVILVHFGKKESVGKPIALETLEHSQNWILSLCIRNFFNSSWSFIGSAIGSRKNNIIIRIWRIIAL